MEDGAGAPGLVRRLQEGSGRCFNLVVWAPPVGRSHDELLVQSLGVGFPETPGGGRQRCLAPPSLPFGIVSAVPSTISTLFFAIEISPPLSCSYSHRSFSGGCWSHFTGENTEASCAVSVTLLVSHNSGERC